MVQESTYGLQKVMRLLQLFERFLQGACISKRSAAEEFGVSEKTIQRDIEDLRIYFADFSWGKGTDAIVYRPSDKGYLLESEYIRWLTPQEVMVTAKILLESRALPKAELDLLLDKLADQCARHDRKPILDAINNERFLYQPVRHNKPVFRLLWDVNQAVRERRILELDYEKAGTPDVVFRTVEPLGIIFSEFYFYLIAHLHKENKEYPAIYRIDRIRSCRATDRRFTVREQDRFQEGQYRQKIQFMQSGELLHVVFRFKGTAIEAVADRLPNARITAEGEHYIVETEVFGRGIKMWLLSQAQYVEVLQPAHFREEMSKTIEEMRKNYWSGTFATHGQELSNGMC
ncbi:hypothetical protein PAESOLCIP111_03428 [Paenibacillus solanacearum]|uniref:WYL domain-containing protein n=1 Tax=Paenibacillus solanacearum TaxID=2048548 RepID=A0A916K2I1_9BACL|nr:WYL domain-containing protein [Paenibacillus solanacearum]CAG7632917.1 hypothetical protein PAESOLCIP111_03428 [Paenibacillus solanacearum]